MGRRAHAVRLGEAGTGAPDLRIALLGLDGAIERLKVGGLHEKAAIAAVEAVMWLATLEEALFNAGSNWRDADPEGTALVEGLLYVRHQSAHELVVYAKPAGGLTFPMTFPFAIESELRWRPWSEDLPLGNSEDYRKAYKAVIADASPVQTLHKARNVLAAAAGLQ